MSRLLRIIPAMLVLSVGASAAALDVEPPQVDIEARIVEANTQVLYNDVGFSGGVINAACVLRPEGSRTLLEASLLATGEGANFRSWVVEAVSLVFGGGERLRPSDSRPYYVTRETIMTSLVPALFAAIAVQYARYARRAQAAKGKACPLSQSGEGAEEKKRDGVAETIEKTSGAAALTLLASQARGEVKGLRVTFDVSNRENKLGDATLIARIVNTEPPRLSIGGSTVPVISKIPILFHLFKHKETEKQDLLIQVTPNIVSPAGEE